MNRPRLTLLPASLILVLASACAASPAATPTGSTAGDPSSRPGPSASASPFPVTLTDDAGRDLTLDAEPMRIVSLAPSHEIHFLFCGRQPYS
jgi:iron complex transport system substrate-binding protein